MLGISCSSFFLYICILLFCMYFWYKSLKKHYKWSLPFFYAAIETLSRLVLFVGLKYFNIGFVLFFILRLGQ